MTMSNRNIPEKSAFFFPAKQATDDMRFVRSQSVGLRSHGQLRVLLLLLQPAEVIGGFMEETAEGGSTGVSQERRVTSLDLLDKLDMGARCPLTYTVRGRKE